MTSPVSIEVEGVPLKRSGLCLKQLGLAYSVRDGYVMISSRGRSCRCMTIPS